MNSLPTTVRLISATIAASVTFLLLGAVLAIAEPQRSVLIAKTERADKLASAPVTLVMASNVTAVNGR